jgi:hypothetical protein
VRQADVSQSLIISPRFSSNPTLSATFSGSLAIERRTAEAAVWLLEQALHEFGGSNHVQLRSVVVPLRTERSRSTRARQEGQARVEKMEKAWNREP